MFLQLCTFCYYKKSLLILWLGFHGSFLWEVSPNNRVWEICRKLMEIMTECLACFSFLHSVGHWQYGQLCICWKSVRVHHIVLALTIRTEHQISNEISEHQQMLKATQNEIYFCMFEYYLSHRETPRDFFFVPVLHSASEMFPLTNW